MRTRKAPATRQAEILDAAILCMERKQFTRHNIAVVACVSASLISHHFPTMSYLRRCVFRAAVERKVVAVVALGLAEGNHSCMRAPEALKRRALRSLG